MPPGAEEYDTRWRVEPALRAWRHRVIVEFSALADGGPPALSSSRFCDGRSTGAAEDTAQEPAAAGHTAKEVGHDPPYAYANVAYRL